jgi:hypothetical protein
MSNILVIVHIRGHKTKTTERFILNHQNIRREILRIFITKKKIMQNCLDRSNVFLILTFGGMSLSNNYISNTMPEMVSAYKINYAVTKTCENLIVT